MRLAPVPLSHLARVRQFTKAGPVSVEPAFFTRHSYCTNCCLSRRKADRCGPSIGRPSMGTGAGLLDARHTACLSFAVALGTTRATTTNRGRLSFLGKESRPFLLRRAALGLHLLPYRTWAGAAIHPGRLLLGRSRPFDCAAR